MAAPFSPDGNVSDENPDEAPQMGDHNAEVADAAEMGDMPQGDSPEVPGSLAGAPEVLGMPPSVAASQDGNLSRRSSAESLHEHLHVDPTPMAQVAEMSDTPRVSTPQAAGAPQPLGTLHSMGVSQEAVLKGTALEPKPDDRLIKVKGLDKQQLCIDLLMIGCVQSFVDFFYITHRKPAAAESAGEQEIKASKEVGIPEETLIFLKETLETAESSRRGRNYQHCFESYSALAEYFDKVADLKSAMYFYKRCIDVATEVDARESIAKANLNLGICEEQANNWQNAVQYHEKALTIATSADSLPLQIKAASCLTHVYQVLAEQSEKENRNSEATTLYERCLHCAQLSKDATLEGMACHKLGLSQHKTGRFETAIELQARYLDICRMHDDRVGESAARAALANAYEATGNTQEAIKQLENLLNVASEAGELKAQASACLNLGILYNGRGDHEKSVELLEQHFDLARQIGDRRLIDSARVVLGIVRGNGKLKSYIELINHDLDKLLKWKSKRATLESGKS